MTEGGRRHAVALRYATSIMPRASSSYKITAWLSTEFP